MIGALLNPIQKYMLRLVLFGAGKTVQHENKICEVVETHPNLRRLLPLVSVMDERLIEGASEPFWVPRRPTDRRQFNLERMWKSRRHRTLPPPVWTGERPSDERLVISSDFQSEFPSASYLLALVHKYGYNIDAALPCMARAHIWRNPKPDRRRSGGYPTAGEQMSGEHASAGFAQPAHPYNPAAPSRRTTQGGGFSRAQVLASVARMRTNDNIRLACCEVVYRRRSPKAVAEEYGIEWGKLRTYATRVRQRIRGVGRAVQKANKTAGSEVVVYTA
jgi:hypothetical protein